ncbi:MAG: lytic transglycosylase domain-containing protein [Deltaproteobacteria bacterium]|nr:lytic transglycosylase domain-containing protein [Deltaproteobacteria bacterium]
MTVAAGLAVVPVVQEHEARMAYARADAQRPAHAVKVNKKRSGTGSAPLAASLRPDPALLEMVKNQAAERPSFDRKAGGFDELIAAVAREHEVSPALVKAVIQAESRFNPRAVSSNGAIGLMQILPSTARSVGVRNLSRPEDNVVAGVRYLKTLLDQFGDDEVLAVAAYNCGPDLIRRYGNSIPPITETRSFVNKVMEYYQSYVKET